VNGGRRFDHGCSQIIDWAHKLDGRSPSTDVLGRFGQHEISFEAVLVIGRDKHLDPGEKQRLSWRNDNVAVNTKKIFCMTFDELLSQFTVRLAALAAVEASVAAAAGAKGGKPPPAANPAATRKPRKGKS
jgi:antiviral defense system Shedu protein SduA